MSNHGGTEDTYATDYVEASRSFPAQNPNMLAGPFLSTEGQTPHLQPPPPPSYTSIQPYTALPAGYHNSSYSPAYNFSYNAQWGALPLPQVLSLYPGKGTATTRLQVWIQAHHDIVAFPDVAFYIHFRDKRVPTTFAKVGQQDNSYIYMVAAEVPLLSIAEQFETIRLTLQMDDGTGRGDPFVVIGDFVYEQYDRPVSRSPATQVTSRKRRASNENTYPTKRYASSSNAEARPKAVPRSSTVVGASEPNLIGPVRRQADALYGSTASPTAVCMPPSTAPSYMSATYLHPPSTFQSTGAPAPPTDPSKMDKQTSPGGLKSQTSYRTFSRASRSPSTKPSRPRAVPISSDSAEPQLIRTSTLQNNVDAAEAGPSSRPYPPYHLYPSKAVLKIEGDLDDMVKNWTFDEVSTQRRLVEFQRSQNGNVITTTFKAVRLEDRAPNSICINCIWWEGRGEAYITSVDTIYLLEALVAVRFTVEEKNRIRRNLEGFRPLTVAKGKPESDDFFKLIMGFPNPRPRNIEKDVKAFPWRILAEALKKIIGKYSASYSTPPGNFQPAAMTPSYSLGSARSEESRQITAPSPRTIPVSKTSTMHSGAIVSQTISPPSTTATAQTPQLDHGTQEPAFPQASSGHHHHHYHHHHHSEGSMGITEPRHAGAHPLSMQGAPPFDSNNWMEQHSAQAQAQAPAATRQHSRPYPQADVRQMQQNQRYQEPSNPQHQPPSQQQQQQHTRQRQSNGPQYLRPSWDYNTFLESSPTLAATPSMVAGSHSSSMTPGHGSQVRRQSESLNPVYFVGTRQESGHSNNSASHPPSSGS